MPPRRFYRRDQELYQLVKEEELSYRKAGVRYGISGARVAQIIRRTEREHRWWPKLIERYPELGDDKFWGDNQRWADVQIAHRLDCQISAVSFARAKMGVNGSSMPYSLTHFFEYKKQLEQAVYDLDPAPIMAAADILFKAWQNKRSVYIFGNGGSWSTAEHFTCDLRKWSRIPGSGGVRAQALTLTPLATAYANDHSYDEIFSRQLNDVMLEGDVAFGISCSGVSANVINALSLAARFGKRIGLTGPLHGPLRPIYLNAECVIHVEAPDIRVQEDIHLAICHILAGEVKVRIAEAGS